MKRMLLLDDDLDFCELAIECGAQNGWKVDAANSTSVAIRLLAEHQYELLVLDLHVDSSDETGVELLKKVDPEQLNGARIVVLTGDVGVRKDALEKQGVHAVLIKPIDMNLVFIGYPTFPRELFAS